MGKLLPNKNRTNILISYGVLKSENKLSKQSEKKEKKKLNLFLETLIAKTRGGGVGSWGEQKLQK